MYIYTWIIIFHFPFTFQWLACLFHLIWILDCKWYEQRCTCNEWVWCTNEMENEEKQSVDFCSPKPKCFPFICVYPNVNMTHRMLNIQMVVLHTLRIIICSYSSVHLRWAQHSDVIVRRLPQMFKCLCWILFGFFRDLLNSELTWHSQKIIMTISAATKTVHLISINRLRWIQWNLLKNSDFSECWWNGNILNFQHSKPSHKNWKKMLIKLLMCRI